MLFARSNGGQTPAMCAIQSKNAELVNYCIEHLQLDPNDKDYTGRTALEKAKLYCAGKIGEQVMAALESISRRAQDNENEAASALLIQRSA